MTKEVTTTKQTSVSNVDISSVINEVIEYTKDQATITDIKSAIASVPIAKTKTNTARKENKYFNVLFIIIPLVIVNNIKQKSLNTFSLNFL